MHDAVEDMVAVVYGRDGFNDMFPSRLINEKGFVVVCFCGGVEEGSDDEGEEFEDEGCVDEEAGACHGGPKSTA
eukprot:CCRYP_017438-RB/>CCRYP_017438-RB protein AED:0.47 eAED:0.92 QI:0/0/0.5/1/0/0/2/28/73